MKVHLVFLLGIILVAAPSLVAIFGWTVWGWIMKAGIITILVGVGLTLFGGDE